MNAKQIKITLVEVDADGTQHRRDIKLDKVIFDILNKRAMTDTFINGLAKRLDTIENRLENLEYESSNTRKYGK
jgi:DNA-binding protein YbaB|tara:strand:+ start:275 stop:496 length:222 start_codon:yes stop_codon:yes gene_type:complete